MQHRAAAAVDGAGVGAGQRHQPGRVVGARRRHDVEQGGPPELEAEDLVAGLFHAADEALDRHVEARHVAAAGEDADAPCHQ